MDITIQLKEAVSRGVSDIFIVAGRPLVYKINGVLTNVDETRLLPPDTEDFVRQIYKLAGERPIEKLLETGDDDFSLTVKGISRFRVSAYKQRSSLAAVVRVITFELPDPAKLHIPEQVLRLADRTRGMRLSLLTIRQRYLLAIRRHEEAGDLAVLTKAQLCEEVGTPVRSLNRVIAQCGAEVQYKNRRFVPQPLWNAATI